MSQKLYVKSSVSRAHSELEKTYYNKGLITVNPYVVGSSPTARARISRFSGIFLYFNNGNLTCRQTWLLRRTSHQQNFITISKNRNCYFHIFLHSSDPPVLTHSNMITFLMFASVFLYC